MSSRSAVALAFRRTCPVAVAVALLAVAPALLAESSVVSRFGVRVPIPEGFKPIPSSSTGGLVPKHLARFVDQAYTGEDAAAPLILVTSPPELDGEASELPHTSRAGSQPRRASSRC